MKYVALFTGRGNGCDYTIGCNKNFITFEETNDDEALAKCKETWKDHGGSAGTPRVETIRLFIVSKEVPVQTYDWNVQDEKDRERRKAEQELKAAEEKAAKLRQKLGKQ